MAQYGLGPHPSRWRRGAAACEGRTLDALLHEPARRARHGDDGDVGQDQRAALGVVPPRGRVHHERLRAKRARYRGPYHLVRVLR
ncbi:MAG TPA: hypothetical protein VFD81_04555 [Methylomirabilota bacterium]|nr:hypothetical protein [Methylomirabilota bacterium]